jgi:hypothetical protein
VTALSELEQRILSELEEAWEEEVTTIANTVFPPSGTPTEIDEMAEALASLVNADLVRISIDYDYTRKLRPLSKEQSLEVINTLASEFEFDRDGEHWAWKKFKLPLKAYQVQIPEILPTQAGLVKAREILEERGYQWWRSKR